MLILRAIILELLICFHVIGAAVLFRRFFPKESPWLCFIVPPLALVTMLNFTEHFIALASLGWLLPLTLGGLTWAMVKRDPSWEGLKFPSVLFVLIFTFVYFLKCLSPIIPNYTEGIFNMTRILNYALSTTLPPRDCWLPPYDYGAYYTFQHYGASIVMRLFSVDLGTAYNLSFAFLLAWLGLAGVGVAHSITGRPWTSLAMAIVLLAGATGTAPIMVLFGHHGIDYEMVTSINDLWDNPDRNPFAWLCAHDKEHPVLKLLPPMYTIYYSEYHGNLGGAFITIVSVLAACEVFKLTRSNWGWICLVALPWLAVITSAWFFFVVLFICGGSLIAALIAGRRPADWRFVCVGAGVALVCIWPSFYSLSGNTATQPFNWTRPEERPPFWMFTVLWWPVWVPWLFLTFIWRRLDLTGRFFHAVIPIMVIALEFCYFGSESLTIEKMWGAVYGAALVTYLPMVFMQRGFLFRCLSVFLIISFTLCLGAWMKLRYTELNHDVFFRLQGDSDVQADHQSRRLLQVLRGIHGVTILPGKSYRDYNPAPAMIGFSENYCYVAYYGQEEQIGRGQEAHYRDDLNNMFYDGKMADPLPFLRSNNIAAVLIWQDDNLSDDFLQKLQQQIGSDYYYINCKVDCPNNAGVFVRQSSVRTAAPPVPGPIAPLILGPTPNP